jgi:hypothetical protein
VPGPARFGPQYFFNNPTWNTSWRPYMEHIVRGLAYMEHIVRGLACPTNQHFGVPASQVTLGDLCRFQEDTTMPDRWEGARADQIRATILLQQPYMEHIVEALHGTHRGGALQEAITVGTRTDRAPARQNFEWTKESRPCLSRVWTSMEATGRCCSHSHTHCPIANSMSRWW